MKNNDKSFIDLDNSEIQNLFKQFDAEPYRLQQINDWIYNKHIQEWQEMVNIPKELITSLNTETKLHPLKEINCSGSNNDPTQKYLFLTSKNNKIESVLMRQKNRTTICISSQSGCAVDCDFCATASMGFMQNLSPGEIVDQALQLSNRSSSKITNVVFMGMGEPLLNIDSVLESIRCLNFDIGIAKIIPSTLSSKPPWPGIRFPVFLTFDNLLKYETIKSPI